MCSDTALITTTKYSDNILFSMALNQTPTIKDLMDLMLKHRNESSRENSSLHAKLDQQKEEFLNSVKLIKNDITSLINTDENHSKRLTTIESEINVLKQEKLKNNVRISGIPHDCDVDILTLVINIASILEVIITPADFIAYKTKTGNFIIVQFNVVNIKHKLLQNMKLRKSLMLEEILDTSSNSQIYLNDQLTPFYANLFKIARKAKSEGKIFNVSSHGGRIKVKKLSSSHAILINDEYQLNMVINKDNNTDTTSKKQTTNNIRVGSSTQRGLRTNKEKNSNIKSSNTKENRTVKITSN